MSSIADRARPSSILFWVVVLANVGLAAAQWRPADAAQAQVPPAAMPAAAVDRRTAPPPAPASIDRVALRRPAPVCRAWGPFTDLEHAESLARQLQLPSEAFEVYRAESVADPDYLVTVRAPGNRMVADRILGELKSRNIDSYILERSPQGSVLAVGVFRRPSGAERRREQLANLGYETELEALQRSDHAYHLLARVPADLVTDVPAAGSCGDIAPMQQFL